jgi:threonine dehydrogenase-like Zn-dependent dehydrogenase
VRDVGMVPSLLTLSDVMGTGWFAAEAANVKPGGTAVVVGDGATGLLAVLSAKLFGAERIIAMSRRRRASALRANSARPASWPSAARLAWRW